jgi:hypothetical protein
MMPDINKFQTIEEFSAAAIPVLISEGKTREQAMVMIKELWAKKGQQTTVPQEPVSKLELLNNFRKQLEKNGLSISEDKLLELFTTIGKRLSTNLTELEAVDTSQEIKILPKKRVWIQKYKNYINLDDALFTRMINEFNSGVFPKVFIDVQHDLGKKYADITQLTIKDDGLYANIELNGLGIDAIKFNKYSYISPDWSDRTDTNKVTHKDVLRAVTLTNIPALLGELPPIQDQITLSEDDNMNEFEKRIALIEARLKAITLADGDPAAMPAIDPEAINNLLTLANEMVAKITELTGEKGAAEAIAETATAELTEIKTKQKAKDKEIFFDEMVKKGKVSPGKELEDWKAHFDDSEEFTRKMLNDRPDKTKTTQLSGGMGDNVQLSDEDRQIAESSGYDLSDPKQEAKFKKVMQEDK